MTEENKIESQLDAELRETRDAAIELWKQYIAGSSTTKEQQLAYWKQYRADVEKALARRAQMGEKRAKGNDGKKQNTI